MPQTLRPLLVDPIAREVIVVVNGSRDGSFELLEELARNAPRLRPLVIETSAASRARQAGVEYATSKVVLLLDDDVIASPDLVRGHARWHANASGLLVLGYTPTLTPPRRRPGNFPTFLHAGDYEQSYAALEREPRRVLRNLWGGNISLRRSDCLRVGLHSDRFANRYHEDRDFGIRCLKAGLEGVCDRKLVAHHAHPRSVARLVADARSQGTGIALVHRLHADVLGPLPADAFEQNLPSPARWIVRGCRHRPVRGLVVVILTLAIRLAGLVRWFGLETRLGQLLRRIERQHGALHGDGGAATCV